MKKIAIMVMLILMLATSVFASPAMPTIMGATYGRATYNHPLYYAFNGYSGESYVILIDASEKYDGYMYCFEQGKNPVYVGHFTTDVRFHAGKNATYIFVIFPRYAYGDYLISVQ